MKKFEDFHPVTLLVYFISVLFPAMFFMDIYCTVWILVTGIIYRWVLIKKIELKNIFTSTLWIVMVTVVNMFIAHEGENILFFINDRAITRESLMYGVVTGCMLTGTFTWFMCLGEVLGGEKIQCIFKHMPKLGLLISMILRLVPRYIEKYRKVMDMNEGVGAIEVSSGVFTYAIENSMQTAETMEMRGFMTAKPVYRGYDFKRKDCIMLIFNIVLLCIFFSLKEYRNVTIPVICMIPFLYRGKEALKLWIYILRK